MDDLVTCHVLQRRFVDNDSDKPVSEEAQKVTYYSLSIGHHIGIIDCFKQVMSCPYQEYVKWIEHLPEGPARRKMSGLLKFGEIAIDSTHIGILGNEWMPLLDNLEQPYSDWTRALLEILRDMAKEPALYVMFRRVPGG
ncbi:MAG: formate hydrogenlyase maturation protein HycH [Desulfovibrio sp.]|nr:formate hydrogenlyase maturation protein HycH [Desulfovibrio sp.]